MGAKKRQHKVALEAQYDPEGLMRARIAYIHEAVQAAEAAVQSMGVNPDSPKFDPPREDPGPPRAKSLPARSRLAIELRRDPGLLPRPDFSISAKRKAL